jgi:CRISPR-associated protein Cst2
MFIKLTARLLVNAHDLNNEASVGTFTDIRRIKLVNTKGDIVEAAAISGNMLKRYHFVYTKRILESLGYNKFCEHCAREESFRLDEKDARVVPGKGELKDYIASEKNIISECAIEDIHGYLSPTRLPVKRDSRVRFSWLVPVEDQEEALSTALHNRVIKVIPIKPEDKKETESEAKEEGVKKVEERVKGMMLFYKQYASGIYAFSASLDVGRIGVSDYNLRPIEGLSSEEISIRRTATIKAFAPIITGEAGASMSRALPIVQPLEILIVASEYPGLPNLISGYYLNYVDTNLTLLKATASLTNSTLYVLVAPKEAYSRFAEGAKSIESIKFESFDNPVEAIVGLTKLVDSPKS